jgi:hypothetical protein
VADDINLPNLISHLAVNLDGLNGTVADASRQGSSVGAALGGGIQRELQDLLAHLPEVQVDANSDEVDRDLARVRQQLDELSRQRIGVDISVDEAMRRIDQLTPHLQRLSDTHPRIDVQAATRQAARQLDDLLAAARRVDDTDVDIDVDADGPGRLAGILSGIPAVAGRAAGALAGVGKAVAAIGAAAPLMAGVVTTLANVAPAAGVAVTGMAAVKLAQGAIKLAAVGMDDALSAALDPSKAAEFNEALKKLSPEARQFAQAVRQAAPALRKLQQDVQDRVFDGLAESLQRTGRSVLPVLRKNLLSSGDALNDMAKGASTAARDLADSGTLGKALGSASKGLHNLSDVPGIVVKSLGQIAAAAGPSFERLTKGAAEAAEGIGERLTKAFESGAMEDAIETAIDLLKDLMEVGGNVGEILGGIFNAVPEGGGIIGTLQTVTQEIADAVNSPEVQEGLTALFSVMSTLAETAAPLLAQALGLIAPIFAELGPPVQELITALGEGLQPVIDELGRSGLLKDLASALSKVLVALVPLLPPLGELAAAILSLLIPVIRSLADLLSNRLASVITHAVIPAVKILAALFRGDFASAAETAKAAALNITARTAAEFASLPGRVRSGLASLAGVLQLRMAEAGQRMMNAAMAGIALVVQQIASLPARASGVLGSLSGVLFNAGASLIAGFIRGIRSMIPSVTDVLSRITAMIPETKGPPAKDAKLLTPAGRLIIEGLIRGIDESTAKLRARLASITKALPKNVRSGVGKSLADSTRELQKLVSKRDMVFKQLAAVEKKIKDLVTARSKAAADITKGILGEANITSGHAEVNSVTAITVGLQQSLKAAQEFQANIAKLKAAGLRSDLLQQIADAGVEAGGATAAALAKATPAELKKINDLQAQLAKSAAATGNTVGDALYQAGIRAAQGLLEGLRSQEGAIERQMRRIANGMLATVKKAHKTKSPSRAFRDIGVMDGEGLRLGLLATAGRVRDAARSVAGAALDVASGVSGAMVAAPTAQQLAAVYAGGVGRGGDTYTINMYGAQATPAELVRELSWRGLVRGG